MVLGSIEVEIRELRTVQTDSIHEHSSFSFTNRFNIYIGKKTLKTTNQYQTMLELDDGIKISAEGY